MHITINRIKNIMLTGLFALAIIASNVAMFPRSASALGGDGTSGSPWQITNCNQLNAIPATGEYDDYYELANDIDCTGVSFTPIAFNEGDPFSGNFNGGNHTISNLVATPVGDHVGLFSELNEAEVYDLTINNSTISGISHIGVLAGSSYDSSVDNVHVIGGTVTSIAWEQAYVGGLVGHSTLSSYENVSSSATISGHFMYFVGGLIGISSGDDISQAMATGSVLGYYGVGGLVGLADIDDDTEEMTYISESFATGDVTGEGENNGGLVGYLGDAEITDITPEQVRAKESLQAELDKFIRLSVAVRGNNDNPEDVNMSGFAGYIFSSGTRLEKRALLSCLNQTLYLKNKAVVTEE